MTDIKVKDDDMTTVMQMPGGEVEGEDGSTREAMPKATFITDLESFIKKEGTPGAALEKLQRLLNALKFIEQRLTQKKAKLKYKLPEIEKSYACAVQMEAAANEGEALTTHYELGQCIYAKAKVNVHEDDKVCLWLGANVMLEYPRAEAIELLGRQLSDAKTALKIVVEDMGFLREQITITEVNMARTFNWDVKKRRADKDKEAKEEGVEVN
uniref:Prefoldin subunit 3 n=1 Tax=Prymnesium polylepis TaxID=72548 RepID=A0A6T7YBK1_9EUKA